ncbi:MAG: putative maltokinase [Chloroflexi bacterium]|nr:putative maltokinase [Chloroflexota bacterium]
MADRAPGLPQRVSLGQVASSAVLVAELPRLVGAIPPEVLKARRWFGGKSRAIGRVSLLDHAVLADEPLAILALVTVDYADGGVEVYHLPLLFGAGASPPAASAPILEVVSPAGSVGVYDALVDEGYGLRLLQLIRDRARLPAQHGAIVCQATGLLAEPRVVQHARPCPAEQSNTSILYDQAWILKNLRKLEFGTSRDLEVCQFLSACTGFRHAPRLAGSIEYQASDGRRATLAVLQEFVPHQGDGWTYVLAALVPLYRALFEKGSVSPCLRGEPPSSQRRGVHAGQRPPEAQELAREAVRLRIPGLAADMERLGRVTGALHRALGSRPDLPAFAPEPVGPQDIEAWSGDLRRQMAQAFARLRSGWREFPAPLRVLVQRFLSRKTAYRQAVDELSTGLSAGRSQKIQIHGDYHLGQVLKTNEGFVVIDFEGEPARPLAERRARQSPLRDVAGMLRSFDYAAHAGLRHVTDSPAQPGLLAWAEAWEEVVAEVFLRGYCQEVAGRGLVPESPDELLRLARFFQVAKAFYELNYELNNRPDWVEIPLQGLERLLQ